MHAFILKNILPKLEMVMQELVSPNTEKQKDRKTYCWESFLKTLRIECCTYRKMCIHKNFEVANVNLRLILFDF
jgi:hypothetical protein